MGSVIFRTRPARRATSVIHLVSALAALFLGCGDPFQGIRVDPDNPAVAGARLYNLACSACHQFDGTGLTGSGPPLAQSDWVVGSEETLIRLVLHGVRGPIQVRGVTYNSQMPGLGFLDDSQIAAILSYIRQAWGNSGSPINAATVARVRAEHSVRVEPWTVAEWDRSPAPAAGPGKRADSVLAGRSEPAVLDLRRYRLTAGPVSLKKIKGNASGLTFNPDTGTLFVVVNQPEKIVEVSQDGEALRSIDLVGFRDTEAVAYLGDRRFVVAEEGRRTLCVFELDADTRSVDYSRSRIFQVIQPDRSRGGLEGVTYDPGTGRLFVVKEKDPRRLFIVSGWPEAAPSSAPWNIENQIDLKDFSGLYFDVGSGHLLVLSDASRAVVEISGAGVEVARLTLGKSDHGLEKKIPKAEGITMDDQRNLWICSEPDLLYRFSPGPASIRKPAN